MSIVQPITVETLLGAAAEVTKSTRYGCLSLKPPVELIFNKTGEKVHAISVDINGKYPGTVHTVEKGFWYPEEAFAWPERTSS